jgi:hypothetical protein
VRWIDEVLQMALVHQATPLAETDTKEPDEKQAKSKSKAKDKPLRAH